MKTTMLFLFLAAAAYGQMTKEQAMQDAISKVGKGTYNLQAYFQEPVAWSNVTVTVTNQIPADAQAQAVYGWYWFLAGKVAAYGARVPVSRVDLMTKMDAAKDEARKAGDRDKVDAIVADGLYLLVAWDAISGNTRDDAWWATPPPDGKAKTEIVTITITVVTRYRWQDYGFKAAPKVEDCK
jgi:hypothetical protein